MKMESTISVDTVRVGIVSPYEIWTTGIASLLRMNRFAITGRWEGIEKALDSKDFSRSDVVIISNAAFSRPQSATSYRPLAYSNPCKIVAVIEQNEEFTADDFVALDVEGLILNSARLEDVRECLTHVANDETWVDPGVRDLLRQSRSKADRLDQLSGRERQVAQLAAKGLTNKGIARELNVSDGTVKMHMHHILSKLNLCSRIELSI